MAYEVVKTIGGRQYRYRVQSERDTQTGKARNRWTYVGRVANESVAARAQSKRGNARLRLLEAAELLLARGDAAALTADAIASTAGVAHGTFYRYFHDRSEILEQLAHHLRAKYQMSDDALLGADVASVSAARHGVRRWVTDKLRFARERRSSMCVWYALIASDARLSAYRVERREATLAYLRVHIEHLNARGYTRVVDPAATAGALAALVEGVIRASILEHDRLDDAGIVAAADIVERALFASLSDLPPGA